MNLANRNEIITTVIDAISLQSNISLHEKPIRRCDRARMGNQVAME